MEFFFYVSKVVSRENENKDVCSYISPTKDAEKCNSYQERKSLMTFNIMIAASVVGIGAAIFMKHNAEIAGGLALGSILCLVRGLVERWYNFNNTWKMTIMGMFLAGIIGIVYFAHDKGYLN
jgi:hypothetical protein